LSLTNEEFTDAYLAACRAVDEWFRPGTQKHDLAISRVTDGIMSLRKSWQPEQGKPNSFVGYVFHCMGTWLKDVYNFQPKAINFSPDDRPISKPEPETQIDWEVLPTGLEHVCRLHLLYGFSIEETGLLLGLTRQGTRKRLDAAMKIIQQSMQPSCTGQLSNVMEKGFGETESNAGEPCGPEMAARQRGQRTQKNEDRPQKPSPYRAIAGTRDQTARIPSPKEEPAWPKKGGCQSRSILQKARPNNPKRKPSTNAG
jgi:hypothetical protein